MNKIYILLIFTIFICNLFSTAYTLDIEDVKSRLSSTQELKYIHGVPFITNKISEDNKSTLSLTKETYTIGFVSVQESDKSKITNILRKFNPHFFNSIDVVTITATEKDLNNIVKELKKYVELEYISSVFSKTSKTYHVEHDKEINKMTLQTLSPLQNYEITGGITNSLVAYTPNDPFFNNQWYLYNTDNSYDLKYLEFKNYLDQKGIKRNFNKNNPVIALVDMGFYLDTAELKDRVWVNNKEIPNNGKDDDGNGYVDDYMGVDVNPNHQSCSKNLSNCVNNFLQVKTFLHGFAMSSIIAAVTNNNAYMTGIVESDVKILPISAENNNFNTIMYYNQAYDYILSLRKRGVNIIAVNLSIGGKYDATEEKMLSEMNKYGILVLASAGNDNRNIDITTEYDYPALLTAKLPNIISVGAVDKKGLVTKFSNYGVKNVNIYMPGDHISVLNIDSSSGNIRVVYSAGTSQAAAVMSGYIGMMYYLYPNMSLLDLKNIILKNSYTISSFTISGSTTKYIANTLDLMLLTNLKM